jgi:hypothetical protein
VLHPQSLQLVEIRGSRIPLRLASLGSCQKHSDTPAGMFVNYTSTVCPTA